MRLTDSEILKVMGLIKRQFLYGSIGNLKKSDSFFGVRLVWFVTRFN